MPRIIPPILQQILREESAGGIILILAAIVAMVVANGPLAQSYADALNATLSAGIGSFSIAKPAILWINDGLMAIFFFLVGLEVKREVLDGQLSSWQQASLPLFAAIGGMAMPALIFLAINSGSPANLGGWAIPAATDIAFALGILALLGKRVPVALKALLLAIAVIDDIGAVAIIALFYSADLSLPMLGGAAAVMTLMFALNRLRVGKVTPYLILAVVLWVFVLKSGVHATLAGVCAAAFVPLKDNGNCPLEKLEHGLHPWVAFAILPIFAFANAGVSLGGLSLDDALAPLPLGIALGLLLGKQVGILGFGWVATRLGWASLPEDVNWRQLHGLSLIAGIGFTMSLFIGSLAFSDPALIDKVKIGVLGGSLTSALLGFLALATASAVRDKA